MMNFQFRSLDDHIPYEMVRAMGRNKVGGVEVEHQRVSNQLTFAEVWSQTVTSFTC